ncbi:hypothetical protein C8R43DRAFT_1120785 [Mycena crocata]|nr:hypothetical protein C8R43DRAFT_1120785 [Mycena crocata]
MAKARKNDQPPPMAGSMALRPGRDKNPGKPDKPRTTRGKGAVEQDKQVKADKKREADDARQQGIENAAAIENRITAEDRQREEHANRAPHLDLTKVLRPRPQKSAPEEHREDNGEILITHAPVDPCSDGRGSSDDFQPDDKNLAEDTDNDMDVSENENAGGAKTGRKKKRARGDIRAAVDAERVAQGGTVDKRKAPPIASNSKPNKRAKKATVGGIRVDWERGRTPAIQPTPSVSRSRSTGSAMSFHSHRRSASSDADFGPPGSDSSAIGGIASDEDDGDERSAVADNHDKAQTARKKVVSIAGIVETEAPGLVPPRRSSSRIRKADITLSHIPEVARPIFRNVFVPNLLALVGTLKAWKDPTPAAIIKLWNDAVAKDHIGFSLDPEQAGDADLILIIVKLAQDKIDGYRHRFADVAVSTLKIIFAHNKSETPAQIAEDVEWYNKGNDRSRVFYYRDIIEDEETGKIKHKGIFQSYLCARVFAVHCAATTVKEDVGPVAFDANLRSTWPIGAMTLGIQAIKRALNYYATGKLIIPSASLGHFSKTNWADHKSYDEGVAVPKLSASAIAIVFKKLEVDQWQKIMAAARAATVVRDEPPEIIDIDAEYAVDDDFDIVDDDSD